MRSLRIRCPNPKCHVILSIPVKMHGQRVRCAGCGQSFLAPVQPAGRTANKKRYRKAG